MGDTPDIEIDKNKILGKGAYGTVYLGIKKIKESKIKIALKEIPPEIENDQDAKNSLSNEIIVSSYLDNTNIVRMIDIVYKNNKRYLAYEYCNGGDLRNYINYFKTFDEELIQIIMIKMVNALLELHKKKVVHHDIKPENILIHLYPDNKETKEAEDEIAKIKKEISSKKYENNDHYETAGYYCNYNSNTQKNNNQHQNMNNFFNNPQFCQNNINFNPCLQNNNNFNLNNNQYNNDYNMLMLFNQFNNNLNNNNFNCMNNFNNNINSFPMSNINNLQLGNNFNNINNQNNFSNSYYNNSFNNQFNNNINSQFNSNNSLDNEKEKKNNILNILKKAQFKLSDFGLSKLKTEINEKNLCGSPLYMAPELFDKNCNIIKIEDPKVDIWALGVMAYEMFFGNRPFQALSIPELINIYKNGKYHIDLRDIKGKKISKELVEFIILCLQGDPQKRANVEDLRNSNFYNISYKELEKMDIKEINEYLGNNNLKDNKLVLSIYKEYLLD